MAKRTCLVTQEIFMRKYFLIFIVLSACPQSIWSRPVSYPGGVTLDITNNADEHSALIHYSPTAKYSVGLRAEYRRQAEYTLTSLQLNNLLNRWNNKDSQANLYLKSGVGYANRNSSRFGNDTSFAAFTGIGADWETRRYFTSYENRYINAGSIDDNFVQKARVGIAPYIADYGKLHTWLMLELEHNPEDQDNITITPLVRFFKDVHRIEAGISNNNDVLFNWTVRF